MNRRKTMYNTNRLAREWLFRNGYDLIWLKPHLDARKKKFKDFYHTRQGTFYATDIYNLFDGMCFDSTGQITMLQISTTNFHSEEPYAKFMEGKKGFKILLIKAVKKGRSWLVKTKQIPNQIQ
jgi:hypothetical protein